MSEPCALVVAPAARRALTGALPEAVAAAAYEFCNGALLEPQRVGKRMRPPLEPALSARRGPYRVLHIIDERAHTVTVTSIHRADVHRT